MPPSCPSELVRAARDGDPTAFDDLTRRFRGSILAFLAVRITDKTELEDLVQETFLTAFRKLSDFRQEEPFLPWLRGIAHNLLRNSLRKRRSESLGELSERLESAAERHLDGLGEADFVDALNRCVKGLDERSARLVAMHYWEGRSFDQMAHADRSSSKAVSMAMVRIRRRLRDCIQGRLGASRPTGENLP